MARPFFRALRPSVSPSIRELGRLVLEDRRLVWESFIFQFLQAASYLPFFGAVGFLIDRIVNNASLTPSQKGWGIVIYALANLALWPLHGWATVTAFARTQQLVRATVARMRRTLVDHLQTLSLSFFTRRGSGALSNQVTVDLTKVETFLTNLVGNFTVMFVCGSLSTAYLVWLNPALGGIVVLGLTLQALALRAVRHRIKPLQSRVQSTGEQFSARIVEFIGGMRTIRSLGNEELVARQLNKAIEDMRDSGLKAGITMRWIMMGQQMIGEYMGVIVWCVGAAFLLHGSLTMGELVVFTALLGFVRQGINSFLLAFESWAQAEPGMEALLGILESKETENHKHDREAVTIHGAITMRGVSFGYPGSQAPVLHELDLEIPTGQRIGLVGETGAGKSTFLDLVLGFFEPTAGEIRFDGRTLADIGLPNLRRAIAIMGQESFLWSTTIRENIRYGRPDATDEEIEQAARCAQAHDFIRQLENGYDTVCAERGSRLSGGQRQRIALARLFLRDPRIIILDEPTSALDLETERRLQDDLDAFCEGRTTFIVAHRLSTLRQVERVLVFQRGRIVEDGTPDELLRREDGAFRRLHLLQNPPAVAQRGT